MTFSDLLENYFQEAVQSGSMEIARHRIAGRLVEFRFASRERAATMTAAMAHLSISSDSVDGPADLTVSMWDGRAEPKNHFLRAYLFALKNWWFDYTGKRGELKDIHSRELTATYHPDTGLLSVVDLQKNCAFYWKSDDAPMAYYEACSPFRSLLHSWMRQQDRFFVHGAAIGRPEGGVLLVGKGGSGKSTSALACLQSPLFYAGDDYCIVEASTTGFAAHSLYCTAKLIEESNLSAFPELVSDVTNPVREPGEKVALSLARLQRQKLIAHFPLRAILLPVVTGRADTNVERCSSREALMAIAPSTLSQLPSSGSPDLAFFGALVRALPCFRLLLGTDLQQVPLALTNLLDSLGQGQFRGDDAFGIPRSGN